MSQGSKKIEDLENVYINGQLVLPLFINAMPIVNPATEEPVGTFPLGKRYDLDRVVSSTKTAFETFHNLAKPNE